MMQDNIGLVLWAHDEERRAAHRLRLRSKCFCPLRQNKSGNFKKWRGFYTPGVFFLCEYFAWKEKKNQTGHESANIDPFYLPDWRRLFPKFTLLGSIDQSQWTTTSTPKSDQLVQLQVLFERRDASDKNNNLKADTRQSIADQLGWFASCCSPSFQMRR